MASTLLSSFRGVVGRLISSSDGVGGVRVPDGVEAFPDTEDPLCFVLILQAQQAPGRSMCVEEPFQELQAVFPRYSRTTQRR